MDSIITKLIPIFILAFIGFLAGKYRLLPDNANSALCTFLFYFCSPAVAFTNILTSTIEEVFNLKFLLTIFLMEITAFIALSIFYKKVFGFKKAELLIHNLCSFYGNIAYTGIPVFLALFNNVIPNVLTLMLHNLISLPAMIFMLDWFSEKEAHLNPIKTLGSTLKNPNCFMPILAAILLVFKVQVPQVLIETIDLMGKPTTTVGMFALGLTCSHQTRGEYSARVLIHAFITSFIKLICCPALAYLIGKFILGMNDWWLNAAVVMGMLPTALNAYILSHQYKSEENYASISVLMTTFLFSITISLYILFIRV